MSRKFSQVTPVSMDHDNERSEGLNETNKIITTNYSNGQEEYHTNET
jgi:hypothetical protein